LAALLEVVVVEAGAVADAIGAALTFSLPPFTAVADLAAPFPTAGAATAGTLFLGKGRPLLTEADLAGAFFAGAYLAGAFLAGAFFAGAFLAVPFFAGAFLAGAFLAEAFFAGAFFAGAMAEKGSPFFDKFRTLGALNLG
jgi:uncharacterized protein YjbI with pentapeptide repeats